MTLMVKAGPLSRMVDDKEEETMELKA